MNTKANKKSLWQKIKKLFIKNPNSQDNLIASIHAAVKNQDIISETALMLEGVIFFAQMQARDIMLPKNQITFIPSQSSLEEIIQIVSESGHSRFPVLDNNSNKVLGILHAKDLLRFYQNKDDFELADIIRNTTYIPESKRLDLLLKDFQTNRNHIAIVVDEYGEICGLLTLENLIEQIIGDIEDEFDIDEEAYIKQHDSKHYILKADTPIELFNESLKTNFTHEQYDTMGGILIAHLGYLPKRGEHIELKGLNFKILNSNARGIKLIECVDLR